MKLQNCKIKLQPLARWVVLIALFCAAIGVVEDDIKGRSATLPVAWPEAIGQRVVSMAIVLLVLWAAGMLSDLFPLFDDEEDGAQ